MNNNAKTFVDRYLKKRGTAKKHGLRRFFAVFALLVALVLVGAIVWLFLPIRRTPPASLLPDEPFAFLSYNVDLSDPAMAAAVSRVKDRLAGPANGLKRSLVGFLLPMAVPRNVTVVLASDARARETEILILAGMGRIARLLRFWSDPLDKALFRGAPVKREWLNGRRFVSKPEGGVEPRGGFTPSAHAVVGDTLVAGTSLYAVMQCADRYDSGWFPGQSETDLASFLARSSEEKDVILYVDNGGGGMSRLVQAASRKYSFAAFPSVDAVLSIQGRIKVLPEKISGSLRFVSAQPDRLEEIQGDVKFIYGALKRVARGSGMNMSGSVAARENAVIFDFELPDYMGILTDSSNAQGGD